MRRSRLISMLFAVCSIFIGITASAQKPSKTLLAPTLPSSFAGWTVSAPSVLTPAVPPAPFDQLAGSDAVNLHEYGTQSIERAEYAKDRRTASITMYRMRDPSAAYGAYTFLRNDALMPVTVGSFGCASRDRALIVVGNLLLDVTGKDARPSDTDLKLLAVSLDKMADHTPFPYIGSHLPEQDRVRRSEHYFIGPRTLARYLPLGTDDWIGFDYSAEAMTASYRVAGNNVTLLLATYPTQQIAADKFDGMLRRFTFDPPGGVAPGQTALFGKRHSALVAVVIGAPSRDVANKLLDQVHYGTEVTWDEPKHTLTDPSISSIVIGAFLGTGAIMVFAFAVGVGFGGFRLFMKVFFPNKLFDREEEIEILQLGIYSKPIRAKDFYQKN